MPIAFAAGASDVLCARIGNRGINTNQTRTFGRQPFGNAAANVGTGAGDQRHFVLELHATS
jgi:hypothetical protein